MGTYYLIRHGETESNRTRVIQGHLDVPLSTKGREQAEACGRALAGVRLDAVYSSDLSRALDTACAIARHHGCQVKTDPRLREINCGLMQGLSFSECQHRFPEFFARWQTDPLGQPRPGGESVTQLYQRVVAALEDILRQHPGDSVAIVTHGGVIRCLTAHVEGETVDPWAEVVDNCAITVLEHRGDGLVVTRYNDTSHLPEAVRSRPWRISGQDSAVNA